MTSTSTSTSTLAGEFRASAALRNAVNSIVTELESTRAQLTGVRGPRSPELTQSFDQVMRDAQEVRGRQLLYPYLGSGLGNGALVELLDGSVKFDMITGIGAHFFGHSEPDLVATAIEAATSDTVMQGHLMMNEEAIRFAETLVAEARRCSGLEHAFLCNSGAMANENALKVCYQKHAPASRVIAFAHCFMGRSVTMAQIGDSAAGRQGVPLSTLVDYMPFYSHVAARRMSAGDVSGSTRYIDICVEHLEQYIERYPRQHACFIFELVQGEGGFNTALPEFHRALMEVCRDNSIAVWADEVQTFGRTERMFCFDALGLGDMVDVACVGKMSQVCAALYTADYNPQPGLLSGTFLGSSIGLRVGQRIIERLRDGGYYGPEGSIARHYRAFEHQVRALAQRHPQWFPQGDDYHDIVGGFGGMMRFTPFGGSKEAILCMCNEMFKAGVIAFYCGHGPYHVRFLPPLGVMPETQWPDVFKVVEAAMGAAAARISQ
ncbi:MAG: aminotransferase class III-fold pyridoxal phosphate-dependent enzyme [Phycisphaerales bacterium]|nr:aminotransferase class III-fold pyridoxal phosphate-dependent enzyme [Phycisphaerales bacterium]